MRAMAHGCLGLTSDASQGYLRHSYAMSCSFCVCTCLVGVVRVLLKVCPCRLVGRVATVLRVAFGLWPQPCVGSLSNTLRGAVRTLLGVDADGLLSSALRGDSEDHCDVGHFGRLPTMCLCGHCLISVLWLPVGQSVPVSYRAWMCKPVVLCCFAFAGLKEN